MPGDAPPTMASAVEREIDVVAAIGLAAIPDMWPRLLRRLLRHHGAADALARLASGAPLAPEVVRDLSAERVARLRRGASVTDGRAVLRACADVGVDVAVLGAPGYPDALAADREAPMVLFHRGDLGVLSRRRVGVVGTRNATAAGRATAAELGEALGGDGVVVVSGLARGVDGAAHRGAQRVGAPAVGVVANGLDRPYPRQNERLWEWVGSTGLLLSEWPPGTPPAPWRFPQRNRIIAALSEVLVVVESRERGGSLITAMAAIDREVPVLAVPGSPRNRACHGTNQLLADGAAPLTCVDDIRVALGLVTAGRQTQLWFDAARPADGLPSRVVAICAEQPCTLDTLVTELGAPIAEVAMAVARLERDGWLVDTAGWFEAAGSRLGSP